MGLSITIAATPVQVEPSFADILLNTDTWSGCFRVASNAQKHSRTNDKFPANAANDVDPYYIKGAARYIRCSRHVIAALDQADINTKRIDRYAYITADDNSSEGK